MSWLIVNLYHVYPCTQSNTSLVPRPFPPTPFLLPPPRVWKTGAPEPLHGPMSDTDQLGPLWHHAVNMNIVNVLENGSVLPYCFLQHDYSFTSYSNHRQSQFIKAISSLIVLLSASRENQLSTSSLTGTQWELPVGNIREIKGLIQSTVKCMSGLRSNMRKWSKAPGSTAVMIVLPYPVGRRTETSLPLRTASTASSCFSCICTCPVDRLWYDCWTAAYKSPSLRCTRFESVVISLIKLTLPPCNGFGAPVFQTLGGGNKNGVGGKGLGMRLVQYNILYAIEN